MKTTPQPVTKLYGCTTRRVAVGTVYEGFVATYCRRHNLYANVTQRKHS